MKRIIHIITGLGDGGAEAVLYRLCYFDKRYNHIVVSLMDKGKYGPLIEDIGIQVYCLDMPSGNIRITALIKLYKLIRKLKPDVVQTWMYHADLIGGLIARLAGVKNIVWGVHHTTLVKGESKRPTILIAKLNAFVSSFVPRRVIYCAEKSRQVQESIGFNRKIGQVVSNGYNINDFIPNPDMGMIFRQEVGLADEIFLVGHVGRYHPFKDYPTLVSAIGFLSKEECNVKVAMVGSELTSDNTHLYQLIEDNTCIEHITLLGKRNDITAVMNGFNLFVLSSVSEAFPNVLNEAMACGIPCITTDVGDAAVIVGNTGWVVPPKDPQALAKAMLAAMEEQQNNPQAWQDRKKACRERIVNNFSIEKMVEGYHKVWFN
ncbi:glycosyltransferase family 4 protein [Vibrio vulnificus]|uniref:glycosyltransferase family 4 protein n=1 Tax=Vibrio vulnificus TaxID=672 RepID=UPI000D3EE026|nr:glycosyltransferase [Vibrio vulnificus]PUZ81413.1 glycosyl transferase family 1 [Vibrio vulnificus]HAS6416304.1 glycosyltransferase [Vibrio vulnificus]HAS8537742.1 glycosyltransferase [Vibrio vulnificus]HDY7491595.1 glycosyltransferase [Vibrio vulnificus]HDY8212960.1 glycosyltransferase [Vibrio vulnificus]